jgi:hypothetical protein
MIENAIASESEPETYPRHQREYRHEYWRTILVLQLNQGHTNISTSKNDLAIGHVAELATGDKSAHSERQQAKRASRV